MHILNDLKTIFFASELVSVLRKLCDSAYSLHTEMPEKVVRSTKERTLPAQWPFSFFLSSLFSLRFKKGGTNWKNFVSLQ